MPRKIVKILHSLAACGLIGGSGAYMVLLLYAPVNDPVAYADMRDIIAGIGSYILLPSLVVVLISGLLSMVVHKPYLHKGWVGVKALLGIIVFKGGLQLIGVNANQAADVARQVAEGTVTADALQPFIGPEWGMLWLIMVISVANVVLGIWRPKIVRTPKPAASRQSKPSDNSNDAAAEDAAVVPPPRAAAE